MGSFTEIAGALSSPVQMVGGLISQGWAQRASAANAAKERAYQKEMADYTHNQDLEMWNLQNEYNSPASQMERFKAAGLNPNLIYGKGSSGNATTLPKYNKYDTPAQEFQPLKMPDLLSQLGQYQDLKIKQVQTDNLKATLEGKQIENSWLNQKLFNEVNISGQKYEKGNLELYGNRLGVPDGFQNSASPYLQNYQATVRNKNLDSSLKNLDINIKKRGGTWSDSAMARYMMLDGTMSGDTSYSGLRNYMLLNTLGDVAKFGIGSSVLKSLRPMKTLGKGKGKTGWRKVWYNGKN